MNQRQLERSKLLIDVIANKITTNQPIKLANYCVSNHICGTAGCVWGDFVIARGGISAFSLKEINHLLTMESPNEVQTFDYFANFISNETLRTLTLSLGGSQPDADALRNYFGVDIDEDLMFGVAGMGGWETRYKHIVLKLWNEGWNYDPLDLFDLQ